MIGFQMNGILLLFLFMELCGNISINTELNAGQLIQYINTICMQAARYQMKCSSTHLTRREALLSQKGRVMLCVYQ